MHIEDIQVKINELQIIIKRKDFIQKIIQDSIDNKISKISFWSPSVNKQVFCGEISEEISPYIRKQFEKQYFDTERGEIMLRNFLSDKNIVVD